jgi:hypothetical protein
MCNAGISSVNQNVGLDVPIFPGAQSQWTERLEFIHPHSYDRFPIYRVMDRKGYVLNPSEESQVCEDLHIVFSADMSSLVMFVI